jgi:hypothetical protein
LLRSPDISGLEADLAEVERHLRRVDADDIFSSQERELERMYYTHWRKRLKRVLANESAHSSEPSQQPEDPQPAALNQVKPTDESWKVITPAALMRAVMKIREDCKRLCDAQRDYLNDKCFKDLHPVAAGAAEPAIFKKYFYGCIGKIQETVKYTFGRFWDISLNQNGLIGAASVQWASLQLVDLIEREDKLVETWIKSVCDKRSDIRLASSEEFMERVIFRTDWRAPKWLSMQPNGNVGYDASTAWERMNEDDTRGTLRYLRESRWIILLKSVLDELVGASHEVLAKRKPSAGKTQRGEEQGLMPEVPEGTRRSPSTKPLMLKYRSGIKRAILGALTRNPTATDAEVCRILDADGNEELPAGWKSRKGDRLFFVAYANQSTKRKIEIAISKIRRDLRVRGFLE